MAVVLDTGAAAAVATAGRNAERDIRKQFVDHDAIDAVILLPDNMFFNTSAPGILVAQGGRRTRPHAGEILLINAGKHFVKGRPKTR